MGLATQEKEIRKAWRGSPMLVPRIEKVVVNMSVGRSGETLEKAMKILEEITGQKPCVRRAKRTIKSFNIGRGEAIACLVTLRRKRAEDFLKRSLEAVGNKLSRRGFDRQGNVSFGIREHIEIPGVKYDPELGIFGMDVSISLKRPGFRIKKRRVGRSKVGAGHTVSPLEGMLFMKEKFGVEIA